MIRWLIVAIALGLSACQPADPNSRTVKQRLEAGEIVEFTKPGYRRPSCSDRLPDWTDIRLSDEDERERIVALSQSSALNPGKHSCFRVGSVITLNTPQKRTGGGLVRITKLALAQLDKLDKRAMKGKFFASSESFYKYKDAVKFRLKPDQDGIVTLLEFEYLDGSAPDEKAIREKQSQKDAGDGYEETSKDGDSLSSCKKPWSDILVAADFQDPVMKSKLGSWFRLGKSACLSQGQTVQVKTELKDTDIKGVVKLTKIKRVKLKFLTADHLNLNGFEFARVKAQIEKENAGKGEEWIMIFDVQPVTALWNGDQQ